MATTSCPNCGTRFDVGAVCPTCAGDEPEVIKSIVTKEYKLTEDAQAPLHSVRAVVQFNDRGEAQEMWLTRGQLKFGPFSILNWKEITNGLRWIFDNEI